ncbi:MAG: hypothetical protein H5T99_08600 [Moorella sp. (in: Bacteria)]|nr:hypothetical protein [Moorella sp. (in: firmicutes)]
MSKGKGSAWRGILMAFSLIFRPWAMESTRRYWFRWIEFGFLHVAIGLAIFYHLFLPFAFGLLAWHFTKMAAAAIALGAGAGMARLLRRAVRPEMRAISSFDDFFSLVMVEVFLVAASLGLMGCTVASVTYFLVAAFLLVYVPTSKLSHYFYWPFARYYYGRYFARRRIYQ